MAHTKRTVTDRVVQYPNRYTLTNVSGTTYDIVAAPGTVTAAGTAVNTSLLQPIEDDLFSYSTKIDALNMNGSNQPNNITVRSNATTIVPLSVDAILSQTANLQEWKVNGVSKAWITPTGILQALQLSNLTSGNNSTIELLSTGTNIYRNIADANTALKVNLANASSTGQIQEWYFGGTIKTYLTRYGQVFTYGIYNIADINNGYVSLDNTGTQIIRNTATAGVALTVNQKLGTSNITNFQFNGVNKASIDKDGYAYKDTWKIPFYEVYASGTTTRTLTNGNTYLIVGNPDGNSSNRTFTLEGYDSVSSVPISATSMTVYNMCIVNVQASGTAAYIRGTQLGNSSGTTAPAGINVSGTSTNAAAIRVVSISSVPFIIYQIGVI